MFTEMMNSLSQANALRKRFNYIIIVLLISTVITLLSGYYVVSSRFQEALLHQTLEITLQAVSRQQTITVQSGQMVSLLGSVAKLELVNRVCLLDSTRQVLYDVDATHPGEPTANRPGSNFSSIQVTGNWQILPVSIMQGKESFYLAINYKETRWQFWLIVSVFLCSLLTTVITPIYLRNKILTLSESIAGKVIQPLAQARQLPLQQSTEVEKTTSLSASVTTTDSGEISRFTNIHAQEYYHRSELVSIFSGLDASVLIFDKSMKIVEANIPGQTIPSSAGSSVDNLTLNAVFPEKLAAEITCVVSESITTGVSNKLEFTLDSEAEKNWWSAVIVPRNNAAGECSGAVFLARNVTREHIHEQIIHDQKEVLYSFFRQSADGLMVVNPEGMITEWNAALEQLSGLSSERALGKPAWVIQYQVLPDDNKALTSEEQIKQQVLSLLHNSEKPLLFPQYERRMRTEQGTELNISTTMFPINTSGGLFLGVTIRDITEKYLFQKAVEEKAHYLQMIIDAAPFGAHVWKLFEDGTVKFMASNKSADMILNINHAELYGKTVEELNATGKAAAPKEYIVDVIKNQLTIHIPSFKPKTEGYNGLLEVHSVCVSLSEAVFFFRDVTEKQKAEQALTSANEFIQQVINSIPAAIISIDSEANVLLYNASASVYITDAPELRHSKQLFSLFPLLEFAKPVLEKAITGQELAHETIAVPDSEERLKYYQVNVLPLGGNSNGGYLFVIDDITKDKVLDQYIIQSEKLASLGSMAAGMAHELNNPLGTIVQGCQNILRRVSAEIPKNQEVAETAGIDLASVIQYMKMRQIFTIIDSMQTAVQKASEIIVHMLQFSRKSSLVKTSTNPVRLIEDALVLSCNDYDLKKKYDFRNITITRDYQENLPFVQVSVNEIEQVFLNILRNAAQAISEKNSEQDPEIIVRLFQENNYIVYEICDNGPGMPEPIRKKVFEPFFTTKDIGEGTGLGLSISYSIITIHHLGKITVDSKEGAGTTFRIALPITSENTV